MSTYVTSKEHVVTKTILLLVASLVIGIFALGGVRYATDKPGPGHNIAALALLLLALTLAAVAR